MTQAAAELVDLDDNTTSVIGTDSVKTYLKEIGRVPLLTASQEIDLAKRIEAGLFARERLDTEDGLSGELRADFEWIADEKLIVIGHCGAHIPFK